MKIPQNNQWVQTNQGETLGVLHSTQNMMLNEAGYIELSPKSFSVYNSDDDSEFNHIQAIKYFNGAYHVVTSNEPFSLDLNAGTVTKLSAAPVLSTNSDAIVFNSKLYVTQDSNFCNYNGSSWTTSLGSLTSGSPHPMTVFDSNPTYKLAIGNVNTVKTYDTSHNANSTVLTLPSQFTVTCLEYRSGFLYVGTRSESSDEARVFIWNGSGTNAQYEVPMGAQWVFSLTPYGNTVAAITDTGELSIINGTSRQRIAALPVYYANEVRWLVDSTPTFGRVHFNGMVTQGNSIYINVDGDCSHGFLPEMKTGVWEYNPNTGLNHITSYNTDKYVIDSSLSITDSVITTSAAHNLKDGDSVSFSAVSNLTGVDNRVTYYVKVMSTTTIKLALSRQAIDDARYITISGTPDTSDKLVYIPNTDWYNDNIDNIGAIASVSYKEQQLANWPSNILFGATTNDKDLATFYTLNALYDGYNIGTFSTQRTMSPNITQSWQELYTFLDGIKFSNEKVIVKKKTRFEADKTKHVLRGVYKDVNVINSYSVTQDEDDWSQIEEGDELTLVDGYGRGQTVHVSSVVQNTNTYKITIDESIGTAASYVYFYYDNWKKVGEVTSEELKNGYIKSVMDGDHSPWTAVKLEIRGFGTKVYNFDLRNEKDK